MGKHGAGTTTAFLACRAGRVGAWAGSRTGVRRGAARPRRAAVLLVGGVCLVLAGCTAGPTTDQAGTPTSPPLMPAPSSADLPASLGTELQQVLEDWQTAEDVPGVTAAVVTPDGTWVGAVGVDGAGTALVPESAMAVGSVTKTFTAAEVMLLSARGLVDLDAPISDHVDLPFDTRDATVRQVLNMSSGFPADPIEAIDAAVVADLDRDFAVGDGIAFVEPDAPGRGTAGLGQEYNNLNYDVLGEMIEQVTGQTYAAAVREDLLAQTDLQRVWVQDDETPQPPLTVGVVLPQDPVVDDEGPWMPSRAMASVAGSAGGIAADAPTVARWGSLLYGGHVIDSPLVEQMTAGLQADSDWYGLGTYRGELAGQPWVGHLGTLVSYHGRLVVFPETATSIAYLVPAPAGYGVTPDLTDTELAVQLHDATTAPG